MPHFFIKKENIINSSIVINEKDENFFHLVKSLRVKINEKIKFIDSEKKIYLAKVIGITKNEMTSEIIDTYQSDKFLKHKLFLIQSILANDAQNLAIANATQSGVEEIFPVISDNVSQNKKSLENKIEKWSKITLENSKQCERANIPVVNEIADLKTVLDKFKKENIIIFAEKDANISLDECIKNINLNNEIVVVIGPEGGFSDDEFKYFIDNKYNLVSLGKMIYKAPNAIVAGISNIVSRLDND